MILTIIVMVAWQCVFRVQTNGLKGIELQLFGTHSKSNPAPSYVPFVNSSIVLQRGSIVVSSLMLFIPKRRGRVSGGNFEGSSSVEDNIDVAADIQLPCDGKAQ